MTVELTPEAVAQVLDGVTPGPWAVDGPPYNQVIWSDAENRVAFMAHSNGLDDARDIANARFIAWAREAVPALAAERDALAARLAEVEAERDAWRKEPESSEAWCAGNQFALDRLCAVLKVDPATVDWDGSDGSLTEEADGLIWRIVLPYIESAEAETARLTAELAEARTVQGAAKVLLDDPLSAPRLGISAMFAGEPVPTVTSYADLDATIHCWLTVIAKGDKV